MRSPSGIVTLLTDFGEADIYVAAMKGVLLSRTPNLVIVDMTHRIPAQDIHRGALALAMGWRAFPAGTVHVAVVDPGVGSNRAIIAAQCQDHFFVAPDNGLLEGVFRDATSVQVHRVTCTDRFRNPVSPTFHGRDIMAPVAADLAQTGELANVGPRVDRNLLVDLNLPVAHIEKGGVSGEVVYIDGFGNAVTNITGQQIRSLGNAEDDSIACCLKAGRRISVASVYMDVPSGAPVAVVGSNGCLEIAVNGGSAAHLLGCEPGDPVFVTLETP